MEICSCGRGKAVYFCNKVPCCGNQMYYCCKCEIHDHRSLIRAAETKKYGDKWLKLNSEIKTLINNATLSYKPIEPLINFLENIA
jgi:ribosomal protein S26